MLLETLPKGELIEHVTSICSGNYVNRWKISFEHLLDRRPSAGHWRGRGLTDTRAPPSGSLYAGAGHRHVQELLSHYLKGFVHTLLCDSGIHVIHLF